MVAGRTAPENRDQGFVTRVNHRCIVSIILRDGQRVEEREHGRLSSTVASFVDRLGDRCQRLEDDVQLEVVSSDDWPCEVPRMLSLEFAQADVQSLTDVVVADSGFLGRTASFCLVFCRPFGCWDLA